MDKVKALVQEQYDKYNLANSKADWEGKQIFLNNKCQDIIHNQWGMGTQGLWDAVAEHVEALVPSQYDEDTEGDE